MKNLGTKIELFAKPIARGIDALAGTDLSGCGGCNQMRDNLNAGMTLTYAIYQRWFAAKQKGEKMKYQMTVVVEAEKMSEVVAKGEALGEVLGCQVRPEPMQRAPINPSDAAIARTVRPQT